MNNVLPTFELAMVLGNEMSKQFLKFSLLSVLCFGLIVPVMAGNILAPDIADQIQANLRASIQSPRCDSASTHLASLVNLNSFYHDALPKHLRKLYTANEKATMQAILKRYIQRTLQQFLCNDNLKTYSFNKIMYRNHHKQLLFLAGLYTKNKQYYAFSAQLKYEKSYHWRVHDYMINTTYLTKAFKVQIKSLLLKYNPKQILVVIDH